MSLPQESRLSLLIAPFLLSLASSAYGAHIIVQDPCAKEPWLATDTKDAVGRSVGEVTVSALEKNGIPFEGSAAGIRAIRQTPTGDAALEVVSDREMRAYGWCFHVNGKDPGLYADQAKIARDDDTVTWFFAFAHYRDGQWLDYCVPTNVTRPNFVCGKGSGLKD